MNESLREIGFEQVLDVDRELLSKTMWFEEQVLGNNQSDFFHSRPVEYSKKSKSFAAEDLF
jgi:ribonucleoside-diphosphate reductase beta chain